MTAKSSAKKKLETFDDPEFDDFVKQDPPKDRWDLLPLEAVRAVVAVLSSHVDKYGRDNWRDVSSEDHYAALMRHLYAHRIGLGQDGSGHPTLAHAACRLLFMLAQEFEPTF